MRFRHILKRRRRRRGASSSKGHRKGDDILERHIDVDKKLPEDNAKDWTTHLQWIPVENYANQLFVEEHISFVYITKICIENQDNKHDGFSALPISTSTFHNKRNSVSLGRFASDSLAWYMLKRSYAQPSLAANKKNFLRSSYKKVAAQWQMLLL
ncbi:hypothetical protein Tco_1007359 [Tanacetum coccineum]